MTKFLRLAVLSFIVMTSAQAFSQATLWVGYRNTSNVLNGYDTSSYTISTSLSLTTDFSATVFGCYGLSLDPISSDMYCAYRIGSGASTTHRLGIVDLTSGAIADIGDIGNVQDLAFVGETLYGLVGSNGGKSIVEIDKSDGSTSAPLISFSTSNSHGFCWDYYNDRILRTNQGTGSFSEIDLTTWTESSFTGGHPGWTNGMTMKDSTTAIVFGGSSFFEWDMTSLSVTNVGSVGTWPHAMAFDAYPLYVLNQGPTTYCSDEPSTMGSSQSGSSYQWMLDGAPVAGATDSSYSAVTSGTYTVEVDGSTSLPIQITVNETPTASFDAAPNPLDLGFTPSGTVDFTNTSTGGNAYWWNLGTGVETSVENPSYSFPSAGSYDVTFVVYVDSTGCDDTTTATIEVINSTGINELSADFSVYPVPTKDIVFVNMTNTSSSYSLELRDLQGRLVKMDQVTPSNSNVSIDLTEMESGVYFLNVFNQEEQGSFKIIKK